MYLKKSYSSNLKRVFSPATSIVSSSTTVGANFATGSFTFNKVPSGSLSGGPDELQIGGVDFTFVSESAGLSNSANQIFVEFGAFGNALSNIAGQTADVINATSATHNLGISASARASLGVYNTKDDLDKLNLSINKCKKIFELK